MEAGSERFRTTVGLIGVLVMGVLTAFLLKSGWEQHQRSAEARQKQEERFAHWMKEKSELFTSVKIPEKGFEPELLILCTIKTKDHEDEQWWFSSRCFGEKPRRNTAYVLTRQDERWRWIPKEKT